MGKKNNTKSAPPTPFINSALHSSIRTVVMRADTAAALRRGLGELEIGAVDTGTRARISKASAMILREVARMAHPTFIEWRDAYAAYVAEAYRMVGFELPSITSQVKELGLAPSNHDSVTIEERRPSRKASRTDPAAPSSFTVNVNLDALADLPGIIKDTISGILKENGERAGIGEVRGPLPTSGELANRHEHNARVQALDEVAGMWVDDPELRGKLRAAGFGGLAAKLDKATGLPTPMVTVTHRGLVDAVRTKDRHVMNQDEIVQWVRAEGQANALRAILATWCEPNRGGTRDFLRSLDNEFALTLDRTSENLGITEESALVPLAEQVASSSTPIGEELARELVARANGVLYAGQDLDDLKQVVALWSVASHTPKRQRARREWPALGEALDNLVDAYQRAAAAK